MNRIFTTMSMLNIRRVVLEKEPTILFTLLRTHTLKYILKKKSYMSAYFYKNRNIST